MRGGEKGGDGASGGFKWPGMLAFVRELTTDGLRAEVWLRGFEASRLRGFEASRLRGFLTASGLLGVLQEVTPFAGFRVLGFFISPPSLRARRVARSMPGPILKTPEPEPDD